VYGFLPHEYILTTKALQAWSEHLKENPSKVNKADAFKAGDIAFFVV
jgi:hypothetical protein